MEVFFLHYNATDCRTTLFYSPICLVDNLLKTISAIVPNKGEGIFQLQDLPYTLLGINYFLFFCSYITYY